MNEKLNQLKILKAGLEAQLVEAEALENKIGETFRAAEQDLIASLKSILYDAGFPTRCNLEFRSYSGDVRATFYHNDAAKVECRNGFDVEFSGGKVTRYSASGISDHESDGVSVESLENTASYYSMVGEVLNKLTGRWADSNLQLFHDTVKNWEKPKYETPETSTYSLKSQIRDVAEQIEHEEIALAPGAKIEYNFEPPYRTRWNRRAEFWKAATVVKITKSTITLRIGDGDYTETRKLDWNKIRKAS